MPVNLKQFILFHSAIYDRQMFIMSETGVLWQIFKLLPAFNY